MVQCGKRHVKHPSHFGTRLARELRWLRAMRGWKRVANWIATKNRAYCFTVPYASTCFSGNMGSLIDREVYLFGGYEAEKIGAFIRLFSDRNYGTILDIGSNVGTHSLKFAEKFKNVHSFEINIAVAKHFQKNVDSVTNIKFHNFGLGARDEVIPLYNIESHSNHGLATINQDEQYDVPLAEVGKVEVRNGDNCVAQLNIGPIDGIKLDVQGAEAKVLSGLHSTLALHRPIIWFEVGRSTIRDLGDAARLRELVPYEFELYAFHRRRYLSGFKIVKLERPNQLTEGDYVIVPKS